MHVCLNIPSFNSSGSRHDVLRRRALGGGRSVREVLRRLQRGGAVEAGRQQRGGLQAVELLGRHHGREDERSRRRLLPAPTSPPVLRRRPCVMALA
jgi:hypothetical protein